MSAHTKVHWLSRDQQDVWRAYFEVTAMLAQRLDADLRAHGLDLAEYEILVRLSEAEEHRQRMSELADAVRQSRSRLTHTVARMEKENLIERATCPSDRRGVWAQLTAAGTAKLVEAAPCHVTGVRENFIDPVDPGDLEAVGRAFAAVLANQKCHVSAQS